MRYLHLVKGADDLYRVVGILDAYTANEIRSIRFRGHRYQDHAITLIQRDWDIDAREVVKCLPPESP